MVAVMPTDNFSNLTKNCYLPVILPELTRVRLALVRFASVLIEMAAKQAWLCLIIVGATVTMLGVTSDTILADGGAAVASTSSRAGYDWWSLQPVKRSVVTAV